MAKVYYVSEGYVSDGYFQTGISVDWPNRIIHVPKIFMTQTAPDSYTLDLNLLRLALKEKEASAEGMPFPKTHQHNTEVVLAGVTYVRVIEFVNNYTVTFENDAYKVNAVGANSNISDVLNLNSVQLSTANSAGNTSLEAINLALEVIRKTTALDLKLTY